MKNSENTRWPMLRDGFIFQLKLGLDAARDLMLSPVSIVFILIDVIKGHSHEQSYFHRLMSFGYKTDNWINLFGTYSSRQQESNPQNHNVDKLIAQIESVLKDQHAKGGVTAAAKSSIDFYLDKLANKVEGSASDISRSENEERK